MYGRTKFHTHKFFPDTLIQADCHLTESATFNDMTMASGNNPQELEDLPASVVWETFGFLVSYNSKHEQVVDQTRMVCQRCSAVENTLKILIHIWSHHPDVLITGGRQKKTVQLLIPTVFKQPLETHTDRAKKNFGSNWNLHFISYVAICCARWLWLQLFIKSAQALLQHSIPCTHKANCDPALYSCTLAVIKDELSAHSDSPLHQKFSSPCMSTLAGKLLNFPPQHNSFSYFGE